jgi:hypothetical protein
MFQLRLDCQAMSQDAFWQVQGLVALGRPGSG